MRRADFIDLLDRLPETDHPRVQLTMRAGFSVCIDVVMRLEENYVVIRGREAGNQDEGRVFFLPFDEIVYLKLERMVRANEVEDWYSDLPRMERKGSGASVPAASLVETPPPEEALDPAEIARKNLLDRIRAARSVMKK